MNSSIKIAGVDEVGRGPLVGNVVAAAVILNPLSRIEGLADSKKLSEKRREFLYDQIFSNALDVAIGKASVEEIDRLNILQASLLAMQRAIANLSHQPDKVLIDGNRLPVLSMPAEAVIKGDSLHACISAASIVAKVTRDREMLLLDQQYPEYGFAQHKGYPTRTHIQALSRHGVISAYRLSFKPVRKVMEMLNSCE